MSLQTAYENSWFDRYDALQKEDELLEQKIMDHFEDILTDKDKIEDLIFSRQLTPLFVRFAQKTLRDEDTDKVQARIKEGLLEMARELAEEEVEDERS